MLLSGKHLPQAEPATEWPEDGFNAERLTLERALNATDYVALSAPYVPAVRAVLCGAQSRYKLPYENAVLLFDHGCLMGRIFFEGRFYALPPLELDAQGLPYWRALPVAQRPALADFCKLPKGILLFYFTLLKQALGGRRVYSQWINPETETATGVPIPAPLRPWLQAVDWPYTSPTEIGCKAS